MIARSLMEMIKNQLNLILQSLEEPRFLTSVPRCAFTQLRQVFTKAPILQHFDQQNIAESRLTPLAATLVAFLVK